MNKRYYINKIEKTNNVIDMDKIISLAWRDLDLNRKEYRSIYKEADKKFKNAFIYYKA